MTTTTSGPVLAHTIGAEGLVSIRVRDGDLRLRGVDGDTLHVRDARGRDLASTLTIDLGEGSASLVDGHGLGALFTSRAGQVPELEVDLPRRATVVVETVNAEIEAEGLLGEQRYRTTSGDLVLRAIGGRLVVEAVSADLDIRATGDADIAARTVSGDVELRAGTLRSIRLTTTSGDVKVAGRLAGPGPFAVETVSGDVRIAPAGDVRIAMATMSGDLHSELDGRTEGSRGHRSIVIGSGETQVTVRTMSGDLDIVRPVPVLEGPPGPPVTPEPPTQPATPEPPTPPAAPEPPVPYGPPTATDPDRGPAPQSGAIAAALEDARLDILRSLERGDIDVAEAGRRFEALDGGAPLTEASATTEPTIDPASETTRMPVGGTDHD